MGQYGIIVPATHYTAHQPVYIRAIGLHHIIGQTIGIIPVVVVDSPSGQQSTNNQRSCNHGSHNGIAIVEQIVGRTPLPVAPEAVHLGKECRPIVGCCTGLHIVGIATAHLTGPGPHIFRHGASRLQYGGLVGNLLLNGLLPQLFFQRLRCSKLMTEPLILGCIAAQREHESYRQPVLVAGNHGTIVLEQRFEQSLCNRDL